VTRFLIITFASLFLLSCSDWLTAEQKEAQRLLDMSEAQHEQYMRETYADLYQAHLRQDCCGEESKCRRYWYTPNPNGDGTRAIHSEKNPECPNPCKWYQQQRKKEGKTWLCGGDVK
jgi:hypothetical protein